MNLRISHGQATRSTFTRSLVTPFIWVPPSCPQRPGRPGPTSGPSPTPRSAPSPEVDEAEGRLLADHVVVQGDDEQLLDLALRRGQCGRRTLGQRHADLEEHLLQS